jgi:hypothetical protein
MTVCWCSWVTVHRVRVGLKAIQEPVQQPVTLRAGVWHCCRYLSIIYVFCIHCPYYIYIGYGSMDPYTIYMCTLFLLLSYLLRYIRFEGWSESQKKHCGRARRKTQRYFVLNVLRHVACFDDFNNLIILLSYTWCTIFVLNLNRRIYTIMEWLSSSTPRVQLPVYIIY